MNQIEEVVREIAEQISEHRNLYLSNEQAVRAQLIEPVLNALGWRTTNPRFVRHNAAFEDGKIPDYTLLKDGKNKLIVEAKNISVTLTDQKIIDQLAGYCYKQGVDFGILTNGVRWLLFSTFQKNPQDRIVWEADLEKEVNETIASRISSFSFENIDRLESLLQISKTLEDTWNKIVSSTDSVVTIVARKLADQIKTSNPALKIDFSDISSFTKDKLGELLECSLNEGEMTARHSGTVNFGTETAFSEVENAVFKRREKISVTFPDGTKFNSPKVVETFFETIKKIGVERILASGILQTGIGGKRFPMISETRNPKDRAQRKVGRYWLMVNYSTPYKYKILREIDDRLNLGLKIDLS